MTARTRLTRRGHALFGGAVALLAGGMVIGLIDLLRLGLFLVALMALNWLASLRPLRGVRVSRSVTPPSIHAGEQSRVSVTVTASTAPTPTLFASEHSSLRPGYAWSVILPAMRRGQDDRFDYTVDGRRRGEHLVGPLTLVRRDGFGLVDRVFDLDSYANLTVWPALQPLPSFALPGMPGLRDNDSHQVSLRGDDDATLREYRHGDELRRIHWPATARLGNLMVRQEDQPLSKGLTVLLDCREEDYTSRPGGSGEAARHDQFEWHVSAAASFAALADATGQQIELFAQSAHEQSTSSDAVTTARGTTAVLDALAAVELDPEHSIRRLLSRVQRERRPSGLLIALIGPLDDDDVEQVAQLRRPGSLAVAIVMQATPPKTAASALDRSPAQWTALALADRGWTTTIASPHASLADVWADIAAGSLVRT